mmetsp:Transcript_23943/g.75179  ORF Transcript_23943/g.75179 Transcript_23943/m.75179 type:complete len:425 (+) Transcript_23943:163-1437(+)
MPEPTSNRTAAEIAGLGPLRANRANCNRACPINLHECTTVGQRQNGARVLSRAGHTLREVCLEDLVRVVRRCADGHRKDTLRVRDADREARRVVRVWGRLAPEGTTRHAALQEASGCHGLSSRHGERRVHLAPLRVYEVATCQHRSLAARRSHQSDLWRVLANTVAQSDGQRGRASDVVQRTVQGAVSLYALFGSVVPGVVAESWQDLVRVDHDEGAGEVDDRGGHLAEAGSEVEAIHGVARRQQPARLQAADAKGGEDHRRCRARHARQGHVGSALVADGGAFFGRREHHVRHVDGAGVRAVNTHLRLAGGRRPRLDQTSLQCEGPHGCEHVPAVAMGVVHCCLLDLALREGVGHALGLGMRANDHRLTCRTAPSAKTLQLLRVPAPHESAQERITRRSARRHVPLQEIEAARGPAAVECEWD